MPVNKSNALGNNIAKFDLILEEVGVCVITAAGADVLAALANEGISSWTAAVLSKVFSSVVKKFLGPVGVAIAVVSLTVCLANESIN